MVIATVSGGEKLEKYLTDTASKVKNAATVKVGFLEGSTYPDGTSVPMVAAIQEFGAPSRGIPSRPFFRNMIAAHGDQWPAAIGAILAANGMDARDALTKVGVGIEGQLRQSIVDTNEPPLAAATVKRKGFDKPLVDTGHMLGSISSEVK
jgi:hypothetical protein